MGEIGARERQRQSTELSKAGSQKKARSPKLSLMCFIYMTVLLRSPAEAQKGTLDWSMQ